MCELLQGEFGSLKAGLTTRSIEAKASDYLVADLSSSEASTYRDVLCKTLYGRLFTWLINRINETIKVRNIGFIWSSDCFFNSRILPGVGLWLIKAKTFCRKYNDKLH